MALTNIKKALGRLIEDLASIEVVTMDQKSTDPIVSAYTRIDIDGDVIAYQDKKTLPTANQVHLECVNAAMQNRKTMVTFLIRLSKNLKF